MDASNRLQLQREIRRVFKNIAFHVREPSAALTRIARKIERHEYSSAAGFMQEMKGHIAGGDLQRHVEEQLQQMAPHANLTPDDFSDDNRGTDSEPQGGGVARNLSPAIQHSDAHGNRATPPGLPGVAEMQRVRDRERSIVRAAELEADEVVKRQKINSSVGTHIESLPILARGGLGWKPTRASGSSSGNVKNGGARANGTKSNGARSSGGKSNGGRAGSSIQRGSKGSRGGGARLEARLGALGLQGEAVHVIDCPDTQSSHGSITENGLRIRCNCCGSTFSPSLWCEHAGNKKRHAWASIVVDRLGQTLQQLSIQKAEDVTMELAAASVPTPTPAPMPAPEESAPAAATAASKTEGLTAKRKTVPAASTARPRRTLIDAKLPAGTQASCAPLHGNYVQISLTHSQKTLASFVFPRGLDDTALNAKLDGSPSRIAQQIRAVYQAHEAHLQANTGSSEPQANAPYKTTKNSNLETAASAHSI